MNLLNLDELTELEREVQIRGINYPIVERSVGVMLDSIKIAKAAHRGGKKPTEEEFFGDMLKTLKTIIPDCPDEVLRGLNMSQMLAVLEFCNSDPNKLATEAVAAGVAAGQKEAEGVTSVGEA